MILDLLRLLTLGFYIIAAAFAIGIAGDYAPLRRHVEGDERGMLMPLHVVLLAVAWCLLTVNAFLDTYDALGHDGLTYHSLGLVGAPAGLLGLIAVSLNLRRRAQLPTDWRTMSHRWLVPTIVILLLVGTAAYLIHSNDRLQSAQDNSAAAIRSSDQTREQTERALCTGQHIAVALQNRTSAQTRAFLALSATTQEQRAVVLLQLGKKQAAQQARRGALIIKHLETAYSPQPTPTCTNFDAAAVAKALKPPTTQGGGSP